MTVRRSLQPLALKERPRRAVKGSPLQVPFCCQFTTQTRPLPAPRCDAVVLMAGTHSNIWHHGFGRHFIPTACAKGTTQITEQTKQCENYRNAQTPFIKQIKLFLHSFPCHHIGFQWHAVLAVNNCSVPHCHWQRLASSPGCFSKLQETCVSP